MREPLEPGLLQFFSYLRRSRTIWAVHPASEALISRPSRSSRARTVEPASEQLTWLPGTRGASSRILWHLAPGQTSPVPASTGARSRQRFQAVGLEQRSCRPAAEWQDEHEQKATWQVKISQFVRAVQDMDVEEFQSWPRTPVPCARCRPPPVTGRP